MSTGLRSHIRLAHPARTRERPLIGTMALSFPRQVRALQWGEAGLRLWGIAVNRPQLPLAM